MKIRNDTGLILLLIVIVKDFEMKVKELIEELSKFDGELNVTFFIQNPDNFEICYCDKMYINTDADGNEVYCIGNHKE